MRIVAPLETGSAAEPLSLALPLPVSFAESGVRSRWKPAPLPGAAALAGRKTSSASRSTGMRPARLQKGYKSTDGVLGQESHRLSAVGAELPNGKPTRSKP